MVAALHLIWAVGINVCTSTCSAGHLDSLLAEEEMLIDWAFKHEAVEFLTNQLIKSPSFFQEVFYCYKICFCSVGTLVVVPKFLNISSSRSVITCKDMKFVIKQADDVIRSTT